MRVCMMQCGLVGGVAWGARNGSNLAHGRAEFDLIMLALTYFV